MLNIRKFQCEYEPFECKSGMGTMRSLKECPMGISGNLLCCEIGAQEFSIIVKEILSNVQVDSLSEYIVQRYTTKAVAGSLVQLLRKLIQECGVM